ncbi:helix-turn-helix domain-containing protein [Subtercola endophyticus]|uniref:helix-turn-helix domain-containing protein n=1 Tax=Subtercola endophyticus TaxID=2895559 RepID=UPI001E58B96F|nr:helix-turn-helix transcriptional regulator [Subtercola endophyticus]UFS58433.1 helix-turn-helix domain-containing protein [Subtercola endophyticus]
MVKQFDELAQRAKAGWSSDTHDVHATTSAEFSARVSEQVELGAEIASARKALSLSQAALSELCGIQQAEISRIERGVGNPTAATLLRLADALGQRLTLVSLAG